MNLMMIGLDHNSAPVPVRERLATPPSRLPARLAALHALEGVSEVAILSTCNRFEVYAAVDEADIGRNALLEAMAGNNVERYLHTRCDRSAALHLCRVAAGLDSLLLGEQEILGQVKDMLGAALQAHTAGPVLSQAIRKAITAGKRARTETAIGQGLRSLGEVALSLAQEEWQDLSARTVLVVGVGRIGKVAAQALVAGGVRWVLVANRTYERAASLADELGGRAVRFHKLAEHLVLADLVIAATGAPHLVLRADALRHAAAARSGRALILVDLAVPRNIDPESREIPGIRLYDMDDLGEIVRTRHHVSAPAVAAAEAIAASEAEGFIEWLQQRRTVPLIRRMLARAEEISTAETDVCLRQMAGAPAPHLRAAEELSARLTRRLLFVANATVKEAAIQSRPQEERPLGPVPGEGAEHEL